MNSSTPLIAVIYKMMFTVTHTVKKKSSVETTLIQKTYWNLYFANQNICVK